ncbi:phage terminase large subunit [Elusimicrobium posterum]|uniref:PBSX family phage terminase large subunit n=1 Tax=Elusimicrobium posterum TaxID=3116653 RepID=UPI003C749890
METQNDEVRIKYTKIFEKNYLNFNPLTLNVGGARSGKSYSVRQLGGFFYPNMFDGLKIGIGRKIGSTLSYSVIRPFEELLKKYGEYDEKAHNKTSRTYDFENGSSILFFGLDDVEKIKSTEFNYIWLEEATDYSYEDYLFLTTRLSAEKPEGWLRNKMTMTMNPGSNLHWIYTELIQKKKAEVINTTYKDNPFLDPEYVKSLEDLEFADKNIFDKLAKGLWVAKTESVYDRWDILSKKVWPKEEGNEVLYGLDFGFNNPSALIKIIVHDGEIYAEEVLYERRLTNSDLIRRFEDLEVSKKFEMIADSEDPNRIKEIEDEGYNVYGAKKTKVFGEVNQVKKYKIHVLESSKNLISELKNYSWKKDSTGKILDEAEKVNDHAMDALRYAVVDYDRRANAGKLIYT